jgi:hypothetical protein
MRINRQIRCTRPINVTNHNFLRRWCDWCCCPLRSIRCGIRATYIGRRPQKRSRHRFPALERQPISEFGSRRLPRRGARDLPRPAIEVAQLNTSGTDNARIDQFWTVASPTASNFGPLHLPQRIIINWHAYGLHGRKEIAHISSTKKYAGTEEGEYVEKRPKHVTSTVGRKPGPGVGEGSRFGAREDRRLD